MKKTINSKAGSAYPFLDARTPMANSDMLPVKLTITLNSAQFRIGLKLYATPDVFEKAMSAKGTITKEAKALRNSIEQYLEKANNILDEFPLANQKMFTNLFKSEAALKGNMKTDMAILFQQKIDELTAEDNAGSKSFYEQSLVAFKRYKTSFFLEDITPAWLKGFKTWWLSIGNSASTAQIHFRSLRHIFNRAIKQGLISSGHYPFKEFTIGSTTKSKDVLYPEQLKKLWEYTPTRNGEERSKDYFIFLYLCNGMNIKDALNLKGSNIKGDKIVFIRSKTANTNHETKEIVIHLHPEIKRIIEKWGDLNTKDYIFPCLRGIDNNIERKRVKDIFARNLNRDLRPIGKKLGFEVVLNLNLARHSYATRLKIDGIPTSMISDALDHSSSTVTEHYLKTIPNAMVQKISESLLNF
ncbi:MAG: site-specific integrase [Chitinophagaceae bacterium]|jgi:integrase